MGEPVPVRQSERRPALRGQARPEVWQSPFRELDELWERMNRWFFTWSGGPGWITDAWTPPVDVEETDDAYVFEVELPGVRKEDVQVELGDQTLEISGELKERERTGVLRHRTRRTGRFYYRSTVPAGVDPDRAEARFSDGILTVRVPRTEQGRPRRLKVQ